MILRKLIQRFVTMKPRSKSYGELFCYQSRMFSEIDQRNPQSELLTYLSVESLHENDSELNRKIEIGNSNLQKLIQLKELWKDDLGRKDSVRMLLEHEDYSKWRKSLRIIDLKCCLMMNKLSAIEILGFLTFLMRIEPVRITQTDFYQKSIETLRILLKRNQLSSEEILILLFFAGLEKKKGAHNVKVIKRWLPPLNKLSVIDHSIIADTLFKCSIKCSRIHKRFIERIIEKDAEVLVEQSHLLIPLCKAVRFAKPSKEFSLDNLSKSIVRNPKKFSAIDCAHIVSLYAESCLKQIDVLDQLFDDFFTAFREQRNQIRIKDVDRLLWSARVLDYHLKYSDIEDVDIFVLKKFKNNKIDSSLLVNIILSMWMLEYRAKFLIEEYFNEGLVPSIAENTWKPVARLQLLVTCIKIEAPDIKIPEELHQSSSVGFKISRNVKNLFNKLNNLKCDLDISDIEINCPIEGIYIPGISLKRNKLKNVHIDVLDENSRLKGSQEPHGLLKLKLRLLKKVGIHSIQINEENLLDDELLLNILRNLC